MRRYEAALIGMGPNGLATTIRLGQAGLSLLVFEAQDRTSRGTQIAELTVPGVRHDICSRVHPLAACSSFFTSLLLQEFRLHWIKSPLALAHPLGDGTAGVLG